MTWTWGRAACAMRRRTWCRHGSTLLPRPSPADPKLFTPGPLTTSVSVKQAMMRDGNQVDNVNARGSAPCLNRLLLPSWVP